MRMSQALFIVLTASAVTAAVWWGETNVIDRFTPTYSGDHMTVSAAFMLAAVMLVPLSLFLLPVFAWRARRGRLGIWTAVIAGAVEGILLMVAGVAIFAATIVFGDLFGGAVIHVTPYVEAIVLATTLGAVAGWAVWRGLDRKDIA